MTKRIALPLPEHLAASVKLNCSPLGDWLVISLVLAAGRVRHARRAAGHLPPEISPPL